MLVYKVNIDKPKDVTFGDLRIGQSFTTNNMVYLKVKSFNSDGCSYNAVRISAEKKPGTSRFKCLSNYDVIGNPNLYHLVHESRLEDLI